MDEALVDVTQEAKARLARGLAEQDWKAHVHNVKVSMYTLQLYIWLYYTRMSLVCTRLASYKDLLTQSCAGLYDHTA